LFAHKKNRLPILVNCLKKGQSIPNHSSYTLITAINLELEIKMTEIELMSEIRDANLNYL